MPRGRDRFEGTMHRGRQAGGDRFRLRQWKDAACCRGVTLIELIVVISIIAILMTLLIPMFSQSILKARERTLQTDLNTLNTAIEQYTLDKQKAPQSLDDLKTAGYVDQIPNDPMTGEPNWEVEQDQVLLSIYQQDPGVTGVHSASNATGSTGEPYSSW